MDIPLEHDEDLVSFGDLVLIFKVTTELIGQLCALLVVGGHLIVHVVCSWCFGPFPIQSLSYMSRPKGGTGDPDSKS